ncbi:HAF repeat/PEP-CTERM domain-containing protein, partial [Candidatus Parcubacteria bacterium]
MISVWSHPALFAQSFQGLGELPGGTVSSLAMDVSADGKVVVGVSNSGGPQAFRWTASGGMKPLGFLPGGNNSYAFAVSEDGSVVTGWSNSSKTTGGNVEAFRWVDPGPMVGLDDLLGGQFNSWGEGIAANGGIIVGKGTSASTEAFLWVFALGMTGLGHLSGGTVSEATDVWFAGAGGDALIVGSSNASGVVNEAFYYLTPGPMVGMGFLPNASSKESEATAISSNGKVIVGWGANATAGAKEAFRYSYPNGPMQGLGFLPPPNPKTESKALDVSADGSVIVGYASSTDGRAAFIWAATNGMRDLKLVLMEHYGLDLTGWKLETATGISDD